MIHKTLFNIPIVFSKKRKTISIIVNKKGQAKIRAPQKVQFSAVEKFVESKLTWIEKTAEKQKNLYQKSLEKNQESKNLQFVQLWGERFNLNFCQAKYSKFEITTNTVNLFYPDLSDKTAILNCFLARQMQQQVQISLEKYILQMQLGEKVIQFCKIQIKPYKSKWGSCKHERPNFLQGQDKLSHSTNFFLKTVFNNHPFCKNFVKKISLSFNLKLAHLPKNLLEYVVLHELCHILQPNHSAKFWFLVDKNMPDYKTRRAELKQYNRLNYF